ncbi:YcxB family protein [Sporolactobacillus pectinivorans]
MYLLNLSALRAIAIPKRFFDKEEDAKTFKQLATDKIFSKK